MDEMEKKIILGGFEKIGEFVQKDTRGFDLDIMSYVNESDLFKPENIEANAGICKGFGGGVM